MIHPYDQIYVNRARNTLGSMLDYAVYSLHQNPASFMELFIASGFASEFESGYFRVTAGVSGAELACKIMMRCGLAYERVRPRFTTGLSKEYICGSALAGYQWESGLSFSEILEVCPVSEIISICEQHQQEIRLKLAEAWPPVLNANSPEEKARRDEETIQTLIESLGTKKSPAIKAETHLKSKRLLSGLSQSGLARISGVPLRTIQQYEQRQKNINKAGADHLIRLANALHCDPHELME